VLLEQLSQSVLAGNVCVDDVREVGTLMSCDLEVNGSWAPFTVGSSDSTSTASRSADLSIGPMNQFPPGNSMRLAISAYNLRSVGQVIVCVSNWNVGYSCGRS
jgi:hypothetical protein